MNNLLHGARYDETDTDAILMRYFSSKNAGDTAHHVARSDAERCNRAIFGDRLALDKPARILDIGGGGAFLIEAAHKVPGLGDITPLSAYDTDSVSQSRRLGDFEEFAAHAMPPPIHGVKGVVRAILWHGILNPIILFFRHIAYGASLGGNIYTANILAIAKVK